MIMSNELRPYMPTHPGEVLKDELQARGISQKKFSSLIGVSYTMLNEILNGKRHVSADMSLLLEAALGIDATLWNNMQSHYNLEMARRDNSFASRLDAIRQALSAACF